MTSDSLLASSRRLPARAAASVERSPAAPTIAAITTATSRQRGELLECTGAGEYARSGGLAAEEALRARAAAFASASAAYAGRNAAPGAASFAALRLAPRATSRKRSGWRANTSSVLSPIEPVEPSTATPITPTTPRSVSPSSSTGAAPVRLSMRSMTPPWPGNSVPLSFTPAKRFEQALGQIARRSRSPRPPDTAAEMHASGTSNHSAAGDGHQRAHCDPSHHTLPGLARGHFRRQAHAAEAPARRRMRRCRRPTPAPARTAPTVPRAAASSRSRTSASHAGTSASRPATAADHADTRRGAKHDPRQRHQPPQHRHREHQVAPLGRGGETPHDRRAVRRPAARTRVATRRCRAAGTPTTPRPRRAPPRSARSPSPRQAATTRPPSSTATRTTAVKIRLRNVSATRGPFRPSPPALRARAPEAPLAGCEEGERRPRDRSRRNPATAER